MEMQIQASPFYFASLTGRISTNTAEHYIQFSLCHKAHNYTPFSSSSDVTASHYAA